VFAAIAPAFGQEDTADTRPGLAPDIREDQTALKFQKGDIVVVPIPISNPTLDTGLVVGGAYFYAQTEEQKKEQPASVTGLGGMYTSNDSKALVAFQQNYWRNDRWRFTGAIGAADIRLSLISPEDTGTGESVDWRIRGGFLFARLSRRLGGDWYGGGLLRVIDTEQSIEFGTDPDALPLQFDTAPKVRAAGLGATIEYDSRDMPTNPYKGRYFKAEGVFNEEAIGSDQTYQTYTLGFKSYHAITDSFVVAWEIQGCQKGGTAPLWDACRIPLRGFSAFDYLGTASASGQVEARWRFYKRWGLVAFGGSGWAGSSFSASGEDETIPSYGAGVRFEVLPAKRINMRLDFARSDDSDAVYFSVGEAF
jgi:hypothetical protein